VDLKKRVEEIFEISAEPAADIASSIFLEGIAGSVVPGVTSAMLAYKQKRSERMVEEFMLETKKRLNELEDNLTKLDEERIKEFKNKYFGLVLDYVVEAKQEEKIKYIVNGFINLADMENLQEDVILIFYDILDELNILDIRVLKLYDYFSKKESYSDIIEDVGIDYEQYALIRNKLERLELIENRAQSQYEEMFKNVANIGEYLSKVDKGKKANLKFKKPKTINSKSYQLTKLGRKFLRFFTNQGHLGN
jgi:hypothetical protein